MNMNGSSSDCETVFPCRIRDEKKKYYLFDIKWFFNFINRNKAINKMTAILNIHIMGR